MLEWRGHLGWELKTTQNKVLYEVSGPILPDGRRLNPFLDGTLKIVLRTVFHVQEISLLLEGPKRRAKWKAKARMGGVY